MRNISTVAAGCKPFVAGYHYVDAINIRTRRNLTPAELRLLRENAESADVNRGHYIPGFTLGVLTIVAPREETLRVLAELPGALVNRLEVAVDVIVDADSKWALRDLFDEHFVQAWHGVQVQYRFAGGSYSRRRGRRQYAWYADRPCKLTGEVDCFHLEGRHLGIQAVRRVGIEHPRDLLAFDHAAYWRKHLTLFEVDCERLGRQYLNRQHRERRRHPLLHKTRGGFVYNMDRATGNALFQVLAAHPDQPCRSVQHFVDCYGRGAFLKRIHIPIVNMSQTILPGMTLPHNDYHDVSPVDLRLRENTTKIEGGESL